MPEIAPLTPRTAAPEPDPARRRAELRDASVAFEAAFLAEMLRMGGVGRSTPGFDGGAGEEAFSGQLVAEQAKRMAEAGGIGLAERLFESLAAKEGLE